MPPVGLEPTTNGYESEGGPWKIHVWDDGRTVLI